MTRRLLRLWQNEDGVAMVVAAGSFVVFVMIAALVVDLAALRLDRRADSLAADAAATAGVAELDPFRGSDAEGACEDAWDYLLLNISDEPAVAASTPDCTNFAGVCDSLVSRTESGSIGPYTVDLVHPVTDDHAMMSGQAINANFDGAPCQRFGVRVQRQRQFHFASVAGFDSRTTDVHAVARIGTGLGAGELVPLLVLEPIACDALYTSGQGKVTVSYFNDTPGIIVVDSNAGKSTQPNRCGNNVWSIDSKGNLNGWIRAIPVPGDDIRSVILSYALSGTPGSDSSSAYDPTDVTDPVDPADISDPLEPPESFYRLYPQPLPSNRRITRAPIDWRYNCKVGYPGYPIDIGDPSAGTLEILDCPEAAIRAPHIDGLRASFGDSSDIGTNPGLPNQWSMMYPCDLQPSDPPIGPLSGDWWIDCPGGMTIRNSVTFTDGTVVADAGIRVFGELTVNQGAGSNPGHDEVVYLRSGDFAKDSQAQVTLERTLVYLDDGVVTFGGGSGGLFWTAPLFGNFEDLALWSEAPLQHDLGGQAGNTLEGTLFTPNADPFTLTGQAGQFQTAAQFLTRRLEVKGQGEVRMRPDPDRITLVPVREVWLIR